LVIVYFLGKRELIPHLDADPKHQVPEVIISDPSTAIGTGYSESKWVAEQILSQASFARSELVTTTVRVGQLSGGLNGCWNMNEWFPSLVQSGSILKKLPTIEEVSYLPFPGQFSILTCTQSVSWIPVNAASVALADIALASSPPAVLHLAHPHPVSWTSIITTIAQALDVSLVPYDEWLLAMEESLKNTSKSQVALMRENPALRLLPFFQRSRPSGEAVPGREAMGLPHMELANAMEIAHSLKDIRRLDAEDVRRWMVYWKDVKAL
jgi:thioester reductase-like protein